MPPSVQDILLWSTPAEEESVFFQSQNSRVKTLFLFNSFPCKNISNFSQFASCIWCKNIVYLPSYVRMLLSTSETEREMTSHGIDFYHILAQFTYYYYYYYYYYFPDRPAVFDSVLLQFLQLVLQLLACKGILSGRKTKELTTDRQTDRQIF